MRINAVTGNDFPSLVPLSQRDWMNRFHPGGLGQRES